MKTGKVLDRLTKRLENLLNGSSSSSSNNNKWSDNDPNGALLSTTASTSRNWEIINQTIKEHPDEPWYVPKTDKVNNWTCPVMLTLGNIDLRDFELERKFAAMRHKRCDEFDKRHKETFARKNDFETYEKLFKDYRNGRFFSNWSKEELEYYSNEDRYPILREGYQPLFNLNHPNWSKTKQEDNITSNKA
jgi:hypothetical protein